MGKIMVLNSLPRYVYIFFVCILLCSCNNLFVISRTKSSLGNGVFLTVAPGECFTKTKIDFELGLTMAGHSCHYLLLPL